MRKIKVSSDFSGIGAFIQALQRLGIEFEETFACDMDKFARRSYLINYGTDADMAILDTDDCIFIDDVYYRGFINTKLKTPTDEEWQKVFDIEESVARSFSFYFPWNVYARALAGDGGEDIYVSTPPCQSFSMAGPRDGENNHKGILFYNSHECIGIRKPRYFILENVRGLMSDDKGKTFQKWIDMLAGKSVNGSPVLFPHEESVPYHVYYAVLNAKDLNIPQNRERVFILGIRDDQDNNFQFASPVPLERKLKHILEQNVDKKYFLSEKGLNGFMKHKERHEGKGSGFGFELTDIEGVAGTITNPSKVRQGDTYIKDPSVKVSRVDRTDEAKQLRSANMANGKGDTGKHSDKVLKFEPSDWANTIVTRPRKESLIMERETIRRLTPRECLRAMDFPDTFETDQSDSQTYKQAGNSIPVGMLVSIIERLNFQ